MKISKFKNLYSTFIFLFFIVNGFTQNVGVGTNTPTEPLDVNGAIKFSGALMPGGNAGTTGLDLTSQGTGIVPIWASATASQQFYYSTGTKQVVADYTTPVDTPIPGLKITLIVPSTGTYDVWAYTDGGMTWNGSGAVYIDSNRAIFGQVSIWVDGVRKRNYVVQLNAPRLKNNLVNGTVNISCACTDPLYPWSICWRESLSAGSHIIEVKGKVYRASSYLKNATYQKRTKIAFSQKQISPFGGYYFDWGWLVAGLIKT